MFKKILPLLLLPVLVFAQSEMVRVTGEYTYTYGDNESLVEAKEICKAMAVRKAIENYDVFVQATTVIEDEELIDDLIGMIICSYMYDLELSCEEAYERTVICRAQAYVNPDEIVSLLIRMTKPAEELEEEEKVERYYEERKDRYAKDDLVQILEIRRLEGDKGEIIYKLLDLRYNICFHIDFYNKFGRITDFTMINVLRYDKEEGGIYKEVFSIPEDIEYFKIRLE